MKEFRRVSCDEAILLLVGLFFDCYILKRSQKRLNLHERVGFYFFCQIPFLTKHELKPTSSGLRDGNADHRAPRPVLIRPF